MQHKNIPSCETLSHATTLEVFQSQKTAPPPASPELNRFPSGENSKGNIRSKSGISVSSERILRYEPICDPKFLKHIVPETELRYAFDLDVVPQLCSTMPENPAELCPLVRGLTMGRAFQQDDNNLNNKKQIID
jgi:hypothetical protein